MQKLVHVQVEDVHSYGNSAPTSGLHLLRIFNAEGTKATESGLKSLRAHRQRKMQGKQVQELLAQAVEEGGRPHRCDHS